MPSSTAAGRKRGKNTQARRPYGGRTPAPDPDVTATKSACVLAERAFQAAQSAVAVVSNEVTKLQKQLMRLEAEEDTAEKGSVGADHEEFVEVVVDLKWERGMKGMPMVSEEKRYRISKGLAKRLTFTSWTEDEDDLGISRLAFTFPKVTGPSSHPYLSREVFDDWVSSLFFEWAGIKLKNIAQRAAYAAAAPNSGGTTSATEEQAMALEAQRVEETEKIESLRAVVKRYDAVLKPPTVAELLTQEEETEARELVENWQDTIEEDAAAKTPLQIYERCKAAHADESQLQALGLDSNTVGHEGDDDDKHEKERRCHEGRALLTTLRGAQIKRLQAALAAADRSRRAFRKVLETAVERAGRLGLQEKEILAQKRANLAKRVLDKANKAHLDAKRAYFERRNKEMTNYTGALVADHNQHRKETDFNALLRHEGRLWHELVSLTAEDLPLRLVFVDKSSSVIFDRTTYSAVHLAARNALNPATGSCLLLLLAAPGETEIFFSKARDRTDGKDKVVDITLGKATWLFEPVWMVLKALVPITSR